MWGVLKSVTLPRVKLRANCVTDKPEWVRCVKTSALPKNPVGKSGVYTKCRRTWATEARAARGTAKECSEKALHGLDQYDSTCI